MYEAQSQGSSQTEKQEAATTCDFGWPGLPRTGDNCVHLKIMITEAPSLS